MNREVSIHAICNREVRVIPKGWQHPEGECLLSADSYPATPEALQKYLEDNETTRPPDRRDYMPSVDGLEVYETEIMAYETTSEGSPISPAFPNTPEGKLQLVAYCAENASTFTRNKADGETWAAILFGGFATVNIDSGVTEVFKGEAANHGR